MDVSDLIWTRAVEQATRTHDAERQALQAKVDKAVSDARERDEEIARLEEAQAAHEQAIAESQAKLTGCRKKCDEQQRELSTRSAQLKSAEDRAAMLERLLDRLNQTVRGDQKSGVAAGGPVN